MRNSTFIKSFLLLCALIVGAGTSWAAEESYTLTFKTSGTTSDSNTSWSTSSKVSDVLSSGADYVSSISAVTNVYPAREGRGAKFGSSKNAGSITFALSNDGKVKATKVVIKGGAYISSNKAEDASVKVNDGTAVAFDQTVTTYTEEEITYNFPTATDITSLSLAQAKNGRFYITSVTVYYEDDGTVGQTPTWTLNPTSATVMTGTSTTLQLTTNYDGTLTFTSNDTETATVDYNASTKVITITGVKVGATTLSVTGPATSTYKAIEKSIDVTVNHFELPSNFTDVMGPFGYSYFGLTPEGTNTFVQPDVTSTDKTDSYGVTISFARAASSNSKPRFDSNYVRFYNGNTLTVTAPSGSYITKIVFTEPSSNKGWEGSMEVETGEYDNSEKTWYASSTGVTEIVFTEITKTNRIGGMEVYLMISSVQATVTAAGWATWIAPLTVEVPSTVKAYYVKVNGNKTSLTEKSVIPAGIPVLLQGEGVHEFTVTDVLPNEAIVNDLLISGAGEEPQNPYVLAKPAGKPIGFYKWTDTAALPTGKVYIEHTTSTAPDFISLGDDATGIEDAAKSEEMRDKSYYNLNGQRVAQPTKGLYIVNGKKVVIK